MHANPADLPSGPVAEVFLVAHTLEIGDATREVRLGVGDRLVVDGGANLLQAVVEQQPGLQVADLPIQVLDGVALDGRDEPLAGFGRIVIAI